MFEEINNCQKIKLIYKIFVMNPYFYYADPRNSREHIWGDTMNGDDLRKT